MIGRQEAAPPYLQSGAGGGGPVQPQEGRQGRRHKPLLPRRTRLPAGPASEGPGGCAPGLQQPCGGPAGAAAAGAGAAGLPSAPACAQPAGSGATQSFSQTSVQGQGQQLLVLSVQCTKPESGNLCGSSIGGCRQDNMRKVRSSCAAAVSHDDVQGSSYTACRQYEHGKAMLDAATGAKAVPALAGCPPAGNGDTPLTRRKLAKSCSSCGCTCWGC